LQLNFKNLHENNEKKLRKVEFHERRRLSEFTAENWLGVGGGGGEGAFKLIINIQKFQFCMTDDLPVYPLRTGGHTTLSIFFLCPVQFFENICVF
jgi:hypothetical protein